MVANRPLHSDGLYMTEEQYLALEEMTDAKYERLNGMVTLLRPPSSLYSTDPIIHELPVNSLTHSALSVRIGALIGNQLAYAHYLVYSGDRRLQVSSGSYLYPDLTVDRARKITDQATETILVVEVLSPTTEKRDRDIKLEAYKTVPTIAEYILICSETKEITVYRRGSNWRPHHYQSGDLVELTSIGVSFPFDEVYRRIFP